MTTSFDNRIVRYEDIHSIKDEQWDKFCSLVSVKDQIEILDLGAGYGSCSRELIKRNPNTHLNITLSDNSEVQLKRASDEINNLSNSSQSSFSVKFLNDDIINSRFSDNTFDVILCKMVIHEIPKIKQLKALREINRILKPGGTLVYWDLYLGNDNYDFFTKIIQKKDELCGFKSMTNNRNFLKSKKTFSLLSKSGFTSLKKEYILLSPLETRNRLKNEFNNDLGRFEIWQDFIREIANSTSDYTLFDLSYIDDRDSISFKPHKVIITAKKYE